MMDELFFVSFLCRKVTKKQRNDLQTEGTIWRLFDELAEINDELKGCGNNYCGKFAVFAVLS